MDFASTYDSWQHNINTRLLWYVGLTLAELPRVHPALKTWFNGGASAFMVAFCLAAFIDGA